MPPAATEIAEPAPPAPPVPSLWRRQRRLLIAVGAVAAGFALYFLADAFVAYTADAYVRSDLVAVAPEVAGIVKMVMAEDNRHVAAGDPLATIDPTPFELDVDLKQRQVGSLEAAVAVKRQAMAADAASLDAATSALRLAQEEFGRTQALTAQRIVSQADLDKATERLRAANDRIAAQQDQARTDERTVAEAEAQVAVAGATLAVAQYALSRTRITAPVGGYINNLTLRPGFYARAGEAIVGIVDELRWRVVANFKEDVVAAMHPGQSMWVWLDSDPWHFLSGTVQGVGRAIAREPGPEQLLPYVAPTTDWIRLRRRLPVTILLDPPGPARGLLMGADARVLFWR